MPVMPQLPPDMQLASEPGRWEITLVGGELIHVLAHSVSTRGEEHVFNLLMEGDPPHEVDVVRLPTSLVRSV